MPHETRAHQQTLYIQAEFLPDWERAKEIAGPRKLSQFVSELVREAVRARNEREGGDKDDQVGSMESAVP